MSAARAEEALVVEAPPATVYRVLADYREHHPLILPKPYFERLDVETGGRGEGTVLRVVMRVMGSSTTLRMRVTEPEPGRVLREVDEAGVSTTFTVEPVDGGARSLVRIATEWPARPGLRGLVERVVNPRVARAIYRKELALLAAYAPTAAV